MNLKSEDNYKVFFVKVSTEFHSQIKALALKSCKTLSELITEALKEYIENHCEEDIKND